MGLGENVGCSQGENLGSSGISYIPAAPPLPPAGVENPTLLEWTGASTKVDGITPYDPADRAGFNIAVVPAGSAVPTSSTAIDYVATSPTHNFSVTFAQMAFTLSNGNYELYMQDEDNEGHKGEWSLGVAFFINV